MLAAIGAAISIISTLLPELINLIKSFKETPQEERLRKLAEVRQAIQLAASKPGNTKPIEDILNK